MKINIEMDDSGNEEIVVSYCDTFESFGLLANVLSDKLNIRYHSRINDFDSLYWSFYLGDVGFLLHYNTYLGTSIVLQDVENVTSTEREKLRKLFDFLINYV